MIVPGRANVVGPLFDATHRDSCHFTLVIGSMNDSVDPPVDELLEGSRVVDEETPRSVCLSTKDDRRAKF